VLVRSCASCRESKELEARADNDYG